MPKVKRGRTLIEVIGKRDSAGEAAGVRLPAWWKSNTPISPATKTAEQASRAAASVKDATPAIGAPGRWITIDGSRIVLSLTSFSSGVAMFAIVAMVMVGFLLGRSAGVAEGRTQGYLQARASLVALAADEIETARKSPPDQDIFAGLSSSPVTKRATTREASAPATAAAKQWVPDHHYIVVQEFLASDKTDADEARVFLEEHGIHTTMFESKGKYRYRLVGDKGFNLDDPAQRKLCDAYHQRIQEIGEQYFKAGGRYKLQGYRKKLTGDHL